MIYSAGESFTIPFSIVHNGVLTNADALPTANLMLGTASSGVLAVASLGTAGRYVITGTIPGGAAAGAKYWINGGAIINGVSKPIQLLVGTVRPSVKVPAIGAYSESDANDTLYAHIKASMVSNATKPTSLTDWDSLVTSQEALALGQIPPATIDNMHHAAHAILSMVNENFVIGGVAQFQDFSFPVEVIEPLENLATMVEDAGVDGAYEFTAAAMTNVSALTPGQDAALALVSAMVGADVTIDKVTDPTCYHLVYKVKGTATEIARKELRDIDGAKINSDAKIPRQLLEV